MGFFFTVFYQPTANILFFLMELVGTHNIAFGILLLMVCTRLLLLVPTIRNTVTQVKMKKISEELKDVQKNITDTKEKAEKTMAIYRREKVNPLYVILFLLIQIPILLAIFFVLKDIGNQTFMFDGVFYSFVSPISYIDPYFLGYNLFENGGVLMGIIVGVSQLVLIWFSKKHMEVDEKTKKFQKWMFTAIIIIAYIAPVFFVATVGFYWFCNNILSILQEIFILQRIRAKQ